MVPCVLGDLLIRVRGSKGLPSTDNKPLPGLSSDESLSEFDGGNYRFDIKLGGQVVGIDDGRIKWIRAPWFDRSTCPKNNKGPNNGVNRMRHLREVGEMRLVAIVIQFPSGLENPPITHPFAQINW